MRLNVYLLFKRQCAEAIDFYQSVLGGKISAMLKVAGSPAEPNFPPESKDNILHACLEFDNMSILASDCPPALYDKPQSTSICINLEDEKEAGRIFNALSKGGNIVMPLEQTFFAKKYGQFVDRFGTRWMIHCA
jgi:PhnB protein